MRRYTVELERQTLKTLAKLDKTVRRRIQAAIDGLAEEPRPSSAVAVKSMPGCLRIRVGDYRIIYEVQDHRLVVLVIDLGHRREIYGR